MSSTAAAQRLRLRLVIEGVELPIISAQVQCMPNTPSTAVLQLPPLPEGTRFAPRSLVHLFVSDPYQGESTFLSKSGIAVATPPGPSAYSLAREEERDREDDAGVDAWHDDEPGQKDLDLMKYKVLFIGEIFGFQWTKTPTNRSLVIQCADLSNYWDYAFQFNNTDLFGPGAKAMFSGGGTNLFDDFLETQSSVIIGLLHQPSSRYPALGGLMGGLIHLLEAIGGSYYKYVTPRSSVSKKGRRTPVTYAGQNIFFSLAELRLHITQLITAWDKDEVSKKLLGEGYDSLFGRTLGGLGEQVSFRNAINALQAAIFYETYAQPCPYFTPGTNGTISGHKTIILTKIRAWRPILKEVAAIERRIRDLQAELIAIEDELKSEAGFSIEKSLRARRAVEARLKMVSIFSALGALYTLAKVLNPKAASELLKTAQGFIKSASVAMQDRDWRTEVTWLEPETTAPTPEKFLKFDPGLGITTIEDRAGWEREVAEYKMRKRFEVTVPDKVTVTKGTTKYDPTNIRRLLAKARKALRDLLDYRDDGEDKDAIPAILRQQVFRPDVWFSAPPRCNVLFPEHYMQISYSRSFMQEPTRLMLKTHDEFFGEDELFDTFYFAPKAITLKAEKNTLAAILNNDVLDHELYTGILPVFEKMGEFNIFAARSGLESGAVFDSTVLLKRDTGSSLSDKASSKIKDVSDYKKAIEDAAAKAKAKKAAKPPITGVGAGVPKVGLAQRSTNFLFFKYRFAARNMSVSALFNPYIACGFPGLVIDRPVTPEVIRRHAELKEDKAAGAPQRELNRMLGTHFLGSFTQVTHGVSQTSGTTDIAMSYPRQVEESVEFLGALQEEGGRPPEPKVLVKDPKKVAKKVSKVAAINPPKVGAYGVYGMRITGVKPAVPKKDKVEKSRSGIDKSRPDPGDKELYEDRFHRLTREEDFGEDPDVYEDRREYPFFQGRAAWLVKGAKAGTGTHILVEINVTKKASEYGPEIVEIMGDPNINVRFNLYEITEEGPVYTSTKIDLPFEEYIRPGWYGDSWRSSEISKVYYDFFNIGAITEPSQVQNVDGGTKEGISTSDAGGTLRKAVGSKEADKIGLATTDDMISVSLPATASVEQAVEFIVLNYSIVKSAKFDVHEFIKAYTWRPIATMLDILGTTDLKLDPNGVDVIEGVEGFHSRAFGQWEKLQGLAPPSVLDIVNIKVGSATAGRADTRKAKQDAVLDYLEALKFSRATLG